MEGFTEATDITTPVEMGRREEPDTLAQVSDISEFPRGPEPHNTDPEDGSDMEETPELQEGRVQPTGRAELTRDSSSSFDQTLVADCTDWVHVDPVKVEQVAREAKQEEREAEQEDEEKEEEVVELRMKKREGTIDRKFARLSQELGEEELDAEYTRVSLQLSQTEEETADQSFDRIVSDTFREDRSEDWDSNDSSPEIEVNPVDTSTDVDARASVDVEASADSRPRVGPVTSSQGD